MTERVFTSLGRSVSWFAASYGLAIVGYLALNALASRLVGESDFGLLVVIITSTTLLGQLGLVGVHRAGLREAAQLAGDDHDGLAELRAGVEAVSRLALPLASLASGAGAWFLLAGRDTESRVSISVSTAILVYLTGQQKLCSSYLRGLGHVRFAGLLEGRSGGALVALSQAVLLLVVWMFLPSTGLAGALAAVTAGFAAPVIAARLVLARRWSRALPSRALLRNLAHVVRRDWKFAVVQAGGYVNSALDLWLCALLLSPVTTSMFGAGQRLAQLLLTPSTSLQVVFAPAIARMAGNPDRALLQRLLRTGSTLSSAVTALMWLPMIFAPAIVLTVVFGADFAEAAPILALLATGYLINALSGLSGITLSMAHHEGSVAGVHWAGVLLRILLGVPAALVFGAVGLAVSSMLATVAIYAMMWVQARRHVGVTTHLTIRPDLRLLTRVAG